MSNDLSDHPDSSNAPTRNTSLAAVGVAYYCLTSLFVVLGVVFAMEFVIPSMQHSDSQRMDRNCFFQWFAPWDGVWYRRIASSGYSYDPDDRSSVAFYPFYPLAAGSVSSLSGISTESALFLTSHLFLGGSFILFAFFMRERQPAAEKPNPHFVLLAFGLFPITFYFRMSYTESTFLFVVLLAMYAMQRRWPLVLIALIVGLATAVRPVGVAVILPFLWHAWQLTPTAGARFVRAAFLLPLCLWGILAYMLYQHAAFGDAFAFVKTQAHWHERTPPAGIARFYSLVAMEPIWSVYDTSSECYWNRVPPQGLPLFNMRFMNSIFVVFIWCTVIYGSYRRWVTPSERLLCLGMFLIPYITHAQPACMASESRYAALAFPLYIVLGCILSRTHGALACCTAAISGVFLTLYTSLFVSWYWFF